MEASNTNMVSKMVHVSSLAYQNASSGRMEHHSSRMDTTGAAENIDAELAKFYISEYIINSASF